MHDYQSVSPERHPHVYTNKYGNKRDGYTSPSRYTHKHINDPEDFQDSDNMSDSRIIPEKSGYGGYLHGTKLQSGNTFYERLFH